MSEDDDYGLSPTKEVVRIDPPPVDYKPPRPRSYHPKIGLVGTGGISEFHLKNYLACGFEVAALASRTRSKAEAKRDEFFPGAEVYRQGGIPRTNGHRLLRTRPIPQRTADLVFVVVDDVRLFDHPPLDLPKGVAVFLSGG